MLIAIFDEIDTQVQRNTDYGTGLTKLFYLAVNPNSRDFPVVFTGLMKYATESHKLPLFFGLVATAFALAQETYGESPLPEPSPN